MKFEFTHWLFHPGNDIHEPFIKPVMLDKFTSRENLSKANLRVFSYNNGRKPVGYEETPTAPKYR